jgi:hypothetical protein
MRDVGALLTFVKGDVKGDPLFPTSIKCDALKKVNKVGRP